MTTLHTRRAEPARAQTLAGTVAAVEADGTFEGYASLFNRQDMGRDVVAPGAFAESLRRRGPRGVRLLFQHDAGQPLGVWHTIREDARGLHVTGRLLPEIARSREVHAMLRAGAIDGLSIGFRALAGKRDRGTGVRRLTKIDLWEISIVTFPMLPDARVSAVKDRPRARASPLPPACDGAGILAARIRALARRMDASVSDRARHSSFSLHAGRRAG
jgi:HK97 family phage prohead protease